MKTKAKNVLTILIILCLIISTILLARFAWAKYIAQINGQATAQIAEMKFKINGDYYKSTNEIEFASTITKQNPKVASGMLAPGTAGYIPITIDARETQTSLEYEISIDLINKPTNLKFYSDETRTDEILVKENNITKMGYIALNSNNDDKIKYENIYWLWEEETGKTRNQIFNNDIEDSKFMDKIMMMNIKVTGTQTQTNPIYLKDTINVGDKIKYKVSDDNIIYGIVVNITDNQVEMMPVDEDGYAESVSGVNLGYQSVGASEEVKKSEAIEAYNNAVDTLNKEAIDGFARKYGYNGATRSITVEDINNLTGFNPSIDFPSTIYTKTYTAGTFIVDSLTTVNGDSIKATSLEGIMEGDTISIGDTIGGITVQSVTLNCSTGEKTNADYSYKDGSKNSLSKYFKQATFMASKTLYLGDSNRCGYDVRHYSPSLGMWATCIYGSNGLMLQISGYVVPVVSIPATTHTKQIADENNPDKIIWEVTE